MTHDRLAYTPESHLIVSPAFSQDSAHIWDDTDHFQLSLRTRRTLKARQLQYTAQHRHHAQIMDISSDSTVVE